MLYLVREGPEHDQRTILASRHGHDTKSSGLHKTPVVKQDLNPNWLSLCDSFEFTPPPAPPQVRATSLS